MLNIHLILNYLMDIISKYSFKVIYLMNIVCEYSFEGLLFNKCY